MRTIGVIIALTISISIKGLSIDTLIQATRYNIIPPSPGVADLGRYGDIAVNNSTGVPEITIPIYTLTLDEVSLPISLSYNASGVRVTDISSEVGLKWNLNTGGVISRTVRGLPDERPETGWFSVPPEYQASSSWRSDINCYQEQLRVLSENLYDPLPDMFDYVLGDISGSFQFSRSKTLFKDMKNDLKIEPYFDSNGILSSITIRDNFGATYIFGGTGYTETCTTYNHNKLGVFNESRSANGVTSWRLQKIITRSNNEIIFTYEDYALGYSLPAEEVYHFKLPLPSPISEAYSEYTTDYSRTVKLLKKIETPSTKVEFLNTLDPSASIWQKKIYEIKISDKLLNKTRSFLLEYEYYSGSARLRLKRIKEKGTSGGINDKITTFNYDTRTLAGYSSKSVDYFGFFNNASNSHFVPVVYNGVITDTVANRDVVATEINRGILTEIVYPTGGKTKFYYEPNQSVNTAGKIIFAPGVRVQKIEEIDADNTIRNSREYTYAGLVGDIQEKKQYFTYMKMLTACGYDERLYYSNPVLDYDPFVGYMYKNVSILFKTGAGVPSHKITEEYKYFYINKKVQAKVLQQRYFKAKYFSRDYPDMIDTLVRSVKNTWTGGTGTQYANYAYNVGTGCMLGQTVICGQSNILVETYYTELQDMPFKSNDNLLLVSSETKDYAKDTINDFLRIEKIFSYNNNYQLVSSIERMNSSEEYRSQFTYPDNYGDPNLQQLTAKNAIALPVTQIMKKVVNGSATTYDKVKYDYDSQGNIIKEYLFDNSITADTVKWNREYTYLPNSNKICQVKSRGDYFTTYLWSYQSNRTVAKVEGARESLIGSLINITALRNSLTDAYIKSTVTQLKNLLPAGKIATTYLYDPIFGITEIKDYNDISTFYTYDEFGRLRLIKEYNSFIKNRFIYNYGTN